MVLTPPSYEVFLGFSSVYVEEDLSSLLYLLFVLLSFPFLFLPGVFFLWQFVAKSFQRNLETLSTPQAVLMSIQQPPVGMHTFRLVILLRGFILVT